MLLCFAKAKVASQDYDGASQDLDQLIQQDPDLTEAYVLYGHCQWLLRNFEPAHEAYVKAIRLSNMARTELKDKLLYQRLGGIFISMKKWNDAKVLFEICAEKYQTAYSYMNLGISCLNLEDYENAEKVLQKANVLDI